MSSNTKVLTTQELVSSLAKTLALEMSKLIDNQAEHRGGDAAFHLSTQLLAAFVAARACNSLKVPGNLTPPQQFEVACASFQTFKVACQEAVAAGFTAAMSEFSGQHVEYYCQIKVVPEPLSKLVN